MVAKNPGPGGPAASVIRAPEAPTGQGGRGPGRFVRPATRLPEQLRHLRTPKPWLVAATLALLAVFAWLVFDYVRLRAEHRRMGERVAEMAERAFTREEVQTQLARDLASTRGSVRVLLRERTLGRALLEEHRGDICLVHVSYRYVDRGTGAPMRIQREGGSTVLVHDVFGTAFAVAPDVVMSNRHVLEPWWRNPEAQTNQEGGFVPRRTAMRAFCPGRDAPLDLELLEVDPSEDLATARLEGARLTALPIASTDTALLSGTSTFLLSYPTGLEAALARVSEPQRSGLYPLLRSNPAALADTLLTRGLIQPLLTYGRIGEVSPDRITFDAPSARGASGGPLFDSQGEVVGVNSEVLRGFSAANFAVPIRLGDPILPGS